VLSLGFLSLQVAAAAFVLLGAMILLMLLALVRRFERKRDEASGLFEELGGELRTARDVVNHVATVGLLASAALLFFALLLRAELVPRWLSIWGLLGASLTVVATVLFARRVVAIRSGAYVGLVLPLALQQLVLATWLVFVGLEG